MRVPDEVESGICLKIEEAVRSVDGVKKVTSVAGEGAGSVVLELRSDIDDVQRVLGDIESQIDRIPSFPELSEEPDISQVTFRRNAIKVGVVADNNAQHDELQLREIAERVRDDLLLIPEIVVAEIESARDYQIDVEVSEKELRKYGLTLQQVAQRIRSQNLEMPGGKIVDDSQEYLLRGKNKRLSGEEISGLPLLSEPSGLVLTVGDIATVRDEFVDTTAITRINGKQGLAVAVKASDREDLLSMTAAVRNYVANQSLPAGYSFEVWSDSSIDVKDRLDLLVRNGLQGLVLVFIVLALFLELRLSFWVALGIPISILGACAVLYQTDQTLNMLSMFAFLIALGIVVDDAIVVGENIYAHRELGKPYWDAAVDGTIEVLPSVSASVTTTVLAFLPFFFVTGVMGKFFAVMPVAIIAMLVISLFESTLILPCHLAHGEPDHQSRTLVGRMFDWRSRQDSRVIRTFSLLPIGLTWLVVQFMYPLTRLSSLVAALNRRFSSGLEWVISRLYIPSLKAAIRRPAIVCSIAIAVLVFSLSLVTSGTVPWVIFPKLDARNIQGTVIFPDGTPSRVADAATQQMEEALKRVNQRYVDRDGRDVVKLMYRRVGSVAMTGGGPGRDATIDGGHVGSLRVELVDNTQRTVTSDQIIEEWREETGEIAGVEALTYNTLSMGPGGAAIEFKLLASAEKMSELESAVEACKQKLATFPGVLDIDDDSRPGKWEIQVKLQEDAQSMGVPLQAVASTIRSAYYGEEVMRLQRGRHEVKLMVRYPPDERRSLANFSDLRIDTGDGVQRPVTELASVNVERGYSEINRIDQKRSITVSADVDEAEANASEVVGVLESEFIPELLKQHPGVSVRWEGQMEQTQESIQSLFRGLMVALMVMFVLLTLEFRSYLQPAIVMAVIPFGTIGALWGHYAMGLPLTLFSMLGIVALTGVVVNDSIVLVDFINARMNAGMPLQQVLLESGRRRFRPVLLTSLTTVAGLLPILTETSFQAQLLIPMANSLCFGLLLATVLVLFLVPTFYSIYGRLILGISPEDLEQGFTESEMPSLNIDPVERPSSLPAHQVARS